MPKKFASENTKAVAAKARKSAAKAEEADRREKALEDEYWRDDDKHINKKKERKELQERKKLEVNQRKAEAKGLIEKEQAEIKLSGKQPIAKITKAQILLETERRNAAIEALATAEKKKENATHLEKPLEENINHVQDDAESARDVASAINLLTVKDSVVDKHPERRLKAAFAAFEEARLPIIKDANPTLKLSQLKQILRKEWQKSPDNPLNQAASN